MDALEIIHDKLRGVLSENIVLRDRIRELESELKAISLTPEPSGREGVKIGLGLESIMKVKREVVLRKWERLSELERSVFHKIIVGYCTEELLLSIKEKARKRKVIRAKSSLIERGFVRALAVNKTSGRFRTIEVYFPSPLGVRVCEIVKLGGRVMPWTYLQYEYAKENKLTTDHEKLVSEVIEKLRHSNYEFSLDEYDLLVRGTNHRADVYVVKPRELYIECETLSNSLEQTFKMLNAYSKSNSELCIVVATEEAKHMMLQRLCFYAWEMKKSISFNLTTAKEIPQMSSYVILR